MTLTTESLRHAIESIAAQADPIGTELNELDGRLGDGDLGVTFLNGFNNLSGLAPALPQDFGMACMDCAKGMTKVSGSSFGTLMAISLMAAARTTKGQDRIDWSQLPDLLQQALDAMMARGGATLGDKTMLDSLAAIIAAIRGSDDPAAMLAAAGQAADDALTTYRDLPCKIGRARIFGDRTVGMDDPGMVAVKRMIDCLAHD